MQGDENSTNKGSVRIDPDIMNDEITAIVNGAGEARSSDKRGNTKGGKRGRKAG